VRGRAKKMRKSVRTTRSGHSQKAKRMEDKRRSQIAGTSASSPRSLSRKQKERIWHNWLVEENYLG
jgi:hypothetical protein